MSIGVQSFNNRELSLLGRIHNSKEAIKTVELIYNSGRSYLTLENDVILMYEEATEFLHSKGFKKYEISLLSKII